MTQFIKQQRLFALGYRILVVGTVLFMFVTPLFGDWFRDNSMMVQNIDFILVIVCIACTFVFNRNQKAYRYVRDIQAQIDDAGSYHTAVDAAGRGAYVEAAVGAMTREGFQFSSHTDALGDDFAAYGQKGNRRIYIANVHRLDAALYRECLDTVQGDLAVNSVGRRQVAVLAVLADEMEEGVLSYSKEALRMRRIAVHPLFVQVPGGKAYLSGAAQKETGFAISGLLGYPDGVLPDAARWEETLPFQEAFAARMEHFDKKSYLAGTFRLRDTE
ncbi:MAG: hypothetical protein LIO46_05515 [Clostridiales bacterium]|nr:hypothetical protein [Clostridiales bacterium]